MAARFQPGKTSGDDSHVSIESDAVALRALARDVNLNRPFQAGEEVVLLEKAALGDRASEERLVAGHLEMVIRLAGAKADQGLSAAELIQEGSIGMVEAVRSFGRSGETDFAGFAQKTVLAQMEVAIATEAAAVRDAQLLIAAATDYERTEILMRLELGRPPSEADLAEKLEWTVDRTRYIAQVVADATRRHDEELLAFVDPDAIDFEDDDEQADLDG